MTKPSDTPSKWTPQEAWKHACDNAAMKATALWNSDIIPRGEVSAALFQTAKEIQGLPFPPDPVERVSDDALVAIETFGTPTPEHAKLMAREIIERRARDKGEKA